MTFDNFRAMAAYLNAQQNAADVEAAERLRRASSLPKPKRGPRVAR